LKKIDRLPILARHVLAVPGAARQALPRFWHECQHSLSCATDG